MQNFKRETSTTVSDLHVNTVSDSVKRLAISKDGHPQKAALHIENPDVLKMSYPSSGNILTVMSNAQDDFRSKYDILREVGKGGFSTVYQCREKATGKDYAVKVVDLRPLRLRERFNPARLRREVDIMKRLTHPNVIQFIAVYEDADHLMLVMEYCPGKELFDVILERKHFQEEDAKPIFAQIARALYYLHSLNIIHRDVKPENVLISNVPNPETGGLVAKLLDFGLSKNAGNGSAAKTFVGTPCYVAPEVEYTSKGLGGTYSFPADCWSLGAVLYVMLVARFPEFEQEPATGKVVVKLSPALWDNVSSGAKDLIRSLMNTNPAARLTMGSALLHPWLDKYRATQEELSSIAVASYDLSRNLQDEEENIETAKQQQQQQQQAFGTISAPILHTQQQQQRERDQVMEITASGVPVQTQTAMVVRVPRNHLLTSGAPGVGDPQHAQQMPPPHQQHHQQLQLAPLLHLQRSIATCFEEVHASYKDFPDVASEVRQGAALCRQQLTESTKMLRKVEQTAAAVLGMFPDLELAVEEGEPQLAAEFFDMVRQWVTELRELVMSTQKINKASMYQIQQIVERSTIGLQNRQKQKQQQSKSSVTVPKQLLTAILNKLGIAQEHRNTLMLENGDNTSASHPVSSSVPDNSSSSSSNKMVEEDNIELDVNHVMELFMTLFTGPTNVNNGHGSSALGAASTPSGGGGGGSSISVDGASAVKLASAGGSSVDSSSHLPSSANANVGLARVYSIDSDGNSIDSTSPDPIKQQQHQQAPAQVHTPAIDGVAMTVDTKSTVGSGGVGGGDRGAATTPTTSGANNSFENTSPRPPRPAVAAAMGEGGGGAVAGGGGGARKNSDLSDRMDSYDSTVSLDTYTREQSSDFGQSPPRESYSTMAAAAASSPTTAGGNSSVAAAVGGGGGLPGVRTGRAPLPLLLEQDEGGDGTSSIDGNGGPNVPNSPGGAAHLADALANLRQVDKILEDLSVFWANTEVVLDLLTKKGQHVEQFIGFASKPRLMARFRERMEEYKRFWENVSIMCSNYIAGVQSTNDKQRMYGFLETEVSMVGSVRSHSSAGTDGIGGSVFGGSNGSSSKSSLQQQTATPTANTTGTSMDM